MAAENKDRVLALGRLQFAGPAFDGSSGFIEPPTNPVGNAVVAVYSPYANQSPLTAGLVFTSRETAQSTVDVNGDANELTVDGSAPWGTVNVVVLKFPFEPGQQAL